MSTTGNSGSARASVNHSALSDSATAWTVALPGSSVHGILQASILEWVAIPFPRGSSDPGIEARSPALQKEMATHSSVLAWRIPGTGEPGGLPPMGSHRVGHD